MPADPEGWDYLTACLAFSDLARLEESWSFLLSQRVVEDGLAHRLSFRRIVEVELRSAVRAPGPAVRVALALRRDGVAARRADERDGWGVRAQEQRSLFDRGRLDAPEVAPFPVPPVEPQFDHTVACAPRPKVWHCIYCGWRSRGEHDDYRCENCNSIRPFLGGTAAAVQCPACGGASLAVASFCEWCGYSLD